MARVPQEEVERLKSEVSLEALVRSKGVALEPKGNDLVGLCPFHEDKEPSLVVTPAKNLWHCLGACQAGGSVIDWVMRYEGVSFRRAVDLLQSGSKGVASTPRRVGTTRGLTGPLSLDADDAQLLLRVVDYYHETLKKSPEALEYLQKRGLESAEMVEHFRLGFANRTLGYRMPERSRQAGAEMRDRLVKLGLLRETGHEHLAGSLVIPVFDLEGRVVEMYGRKVGNQLRKGTPLHLYLPGPHRGVFNEAALGAAESVILCESLIDALSFWCAGFRNVTASYGVEGFTKGHLEAFKRHQVKRVLIAYDRDVAGDAAAEKLAKKLMAEGFECFRVLFPRGMDANSYACSVKPAARSLELLVRKAMWMGKGEAPRPQELPAAAGTEPAASLAAKEERPEPGEASEPGEGAGSSLAPADPLPPAPRPELEVERTDDEVRCVIGRRRWRVRGLSKNHSYEQLKVNILVSQGERFFVDNFNLYAARPRSLFLKEASRELELSEEVLKKDLGKLLLKLEDMQEQQIHKAQQPELVEVTLSEQERAEALELLRDPRLLERILEDFEACGVVGEETNKLVGYLAAVSRKLEEPLAVIVQSSSAAGKSSLMESILAFVPEEDRTKYSAMTGQSLFYMGERDLKHKILAVVEEEGAERASYALKLLQSEGELTIASTGKDPDTGRLVTHEYRVEGPVMIFLTTTAIEVDEELLNRCMVLTVDEDREQTRAIHKLQRQRKTLEGLLATQDRGRLRKVHQDAQRLLRPILVANPFAERLTFIDDRTRTRRDHMKYLSLIQSIALLHQHQRPVRTVSHRGQELQYIEVTLGDIAVANRLAHQVLGRSLDELPPQTRRMLELLHELVTERCRELDMSREAFRFTRREVRERTGWSEFQVRIHMGKLAELEYLLLHRSPRGQSFVYELLYDGEGRDGSSFLMGLAGTEQLGRGYDANLEHGNGGFEHEKGGLEHGASPQSAPIVIRSSQQNGNEDRGLRGVPPISGKSTYGEKQPKSYVLRSRSSTQVAVRGG